MNDTKKFREIAADFRGAADAADKVADVLEKENHAPEELEEATKNFIWEIAKIQVMS